MKQQAANHMFTVLYGTKEQNKDNAVEKYNKIQVNLQQISNIHPTKETPNVNIRVCVIIKMIDW